MTIKRTLAATLLCFTVFPALLSRSSADVMVGSSAWCPNGICQEGYTLSSPPIFSDQWVPFDSDELLVWGADVCLGYFLTKHETSWNGGARNTEVDDLYGLYISLEDRIARVHIYNWPFHTEDETYRKYGTFNCQNTRWPERSVGSTDLDAVSNWISARLTKEEGWEGKVNDWDARQVGDFRNEELRLSIDLTNQGGHLNIQFRADYFGPTIVYD